MTSPVTSEWCVTHLLPGRWPRETARTSNPGVVDAPEDESDPGVLDARERLRLLQLVGEAEQYGLAAGAGPEHHPERQPGRRLREREGDGGLAGGVLERGEDDPLEESL